MLWTDILFELTRRILPPGNLDELLNVTNFFGLNARNSAQIYK